MNAQPEMWAGTADLIRLFVEMGTAFAADLGYGEDEFFSALENMLSRALDLLRGGSTDLTQSMRSRLLRLSGSARDLGWGYGDFVVNAVAEIVQSERVKTRHAAIRPLRGPL